MTITIEQIRALKPITYEEHAQLHNKQFPDKPVCAGQLRYWTEIGQFIGEFGPIMLDDRNIICHEGWWFE